MGTVKVPVVEIVGFETVRKIRSMKKMIVSANEWLDFGKLKNDWDLDFWSCDWSFFTKVHFFSP